MNVEPNSPLTAMHDPVPNTRKLARGRQDQFLNQVRNDLDMGRKTRRERHFVPAGSRTGRQSRAYVLDLPLGEDVEF